ncbi:hypothetical protein [Streptomyces sp. NPDC127084]|uniref:hypothetical protein n=1 Tax=Streptomyces sp. NPDC127084 TaxID=3347133 RepID=UPI0036494D36
MSNASEVLKEGSNYLLFVPADKKSGRYVITGGRGSYIMDSRSGKYRFKGGEETELPRSVTLADLR